MTSTHYIIIGIAILLLIGACSGVKSKVDPAVPLLPEILSDDLKVTHLPHITTLQYASDGNIHAFGRQPQDTTAPKHQHKYLFVYDPVTFELKKSTFITDNKRGLAFVDLESNLYISKQGSNGGFDQYSYPDYKRSVVPFHPAAIVLDQILLEELRPSKNSPTRDEYMRLKREKNQAAIDENREQIKVRLIAAQNKFIDLDAIAYVYLQRGSSYILFMKDGAVFILPNYRGMNGNAAVADYLRKGNKFTIYKDYKRKDVGRSIANMQLAEKTTTSDPLKNTAFEVTDQKTTFENWPNTGYTRGWYGYELNVLGGTAQFKVLSLKKSGGSGVYYLAKADAPIGFLAGKGWYLIQPKS